MGRLIVTSPKLNDVLRLDNQYQITWEEIGEALRNVRIALRKSTIGFVMNIDEDTPNDHSYFWKVPTTLTPADDYCIRIRPIDGLHVDTAYADHDDVHGDIAHGDTAHDDIAHGDAYTDHDDGIVPPTHEDEYTDTPHTDTPHDDVAHTDNPAHDDVPHEDGTYDDGDDFEIKDKFIIEDFRNAP